MIEQTTQRKKEHLFLVLGMIFLTNAIVAEFIGAKIFSLEKTLGLQPAAIKLFGNELLHLLFFLPINTYDV